MSATATQSAKTSVPESDPGSLQSKTQEKGADREPAQSLGSTQRDEVPRDRQKIAELAYFYWKRAKPAMGLRKKTGSERNKKFMEALVS
jgi:hypothetical protein